MGDEEEEHREAAEAAGLDPEEFLGLVTAIDGTIAMAPQMMRALYAHYSAAVEAGFTEEQAFALVLSRAQSWFNL